jgi:hypothetical protein
VQGDIGNQGVQGVKGDIGDASNLLGSNNSWTGVNRFGDTKFLFRDTNHFIGGISPNIDGPMIHGYSGVDIGFSNPFTSKLIVSSAGLKMDGSTLTGTIWKYLSTINSNVQDQLNNIPSQLSSYFNNTPVTSKFYKATNGRIGIRNQAWQINFPKSFSISDFGNDQLIIYSRPNDNNQTRYIELPDSKQSEGQRITVWNNSGNRLFIDTAASDNLFVNSIDGNKTMTLKNLEISNIISNYYNWVVIRENGKGTVLQNNSNCQSYSSLASYNIGRQNNNIDIFSATIDPKSSNSTLIFDFDVTWRINGGSGFDYFTSLIFIDNVLIGKKTLNLNANNGDQANRNSSTGLFPISGAIFNNNLNSKVFRVQIQINADDTVILEDYWKYTFQEIQN